MQSYNEEALLGTVITLPAIYLKFLGGIGIPLLQGPNYRAQGQDSK